MFAIFCSIQVNELTAKSFANLGLSSQEFSSVNTNTILEFPKDHGSHPSFKTEWWYVTANLENENGEYFGVQWTLFRSAIKNSSTDSGWESSQLWMGHSAVTTITSHFFSEKFARGGIGQAGVKLFPFEAWIDDWSFSGDWDSTLLIASGDQFSYKLNLTSKMPLIFHGSNGISKKSHSGTNSFYYSQPFFDVNGFLTINGIKHKVVGKAWGDREWSSQLLDETQIGWNWLGLHFDDGSKLMLFEVKSDGGNNFLSGTKISKHGTYETLQAEDFSLLAGSSENSESEAITLDWNIKIPKYNIYITVRPLNRNSYMKTLIPYWEGPVSFTGTHNGVGFLEVTMTE